MAKSFIAGASTVAAFDVLWLKLFEDSLGVSSVLFPVRLAATGINEINTTKPNHRIVPTFRSKFLIARDPL